MQCKSGRTYVRHKFFKMDLPKPKSEKSFAQQMISKNQVSKGNIFTGKNARFLKVLTTFYKGISENCQYILYAYSTISYNCSKRSGADIFTPASFNGIRNCLHVKKKKINIQYFLFAVDDVKTNNLGLYFRKVFRYKYFCKKYFWVL